MKNGATAAEEPLTDGTPHDGAIVDAPAAAEQAGLVYVSDEEPGIRRRRSGKGFSFRGPDGKPVKDKETLARIKALAIPPAYTDVWICADPRGHIQATGRDDRGRKQYRYHARWREVRGPFQHSASASRPTWPGAACRAKRCWRPSSTCWRTP
jgi:DNA topoisomerase-1